MKRNLGRRRGGGGARERKRMESFNWKEIRPPLQKSSVSWKGRARKKVERKKQSN